MHMRTRVLFAVISCTLCVQEASAQYRFEKLISVPWGNQISDVGIRCEIDGNYGPQSFDVNGGRIFLLDTEHRLVKIYENGGDLRSTIPVPQFAQDIAVSDNQHIYVLSGGNAVTEFDERAILKTEIRFDDDGPVVTGIRKGRSGLILYMSSGESCEIAPGPSSVRRLSTLVTRRLGYLNTTGYGCYTEKKNRALGSVSLSDDRGHLASSFAIAFEQDDLASLRFLGSDSSGNVYLDVERFVQKIPLKVHREIREYSFSGELLSVIRLPRIYHSYAFTDIRIGAGGEVYHLLSRESGIEVVRWRTDSLRGNTSDHTVHVAECPGEYQYELHYNCLQREGFHGDMVSGIPQITSVTRDEALQIADTYVKHTWVCHDNNLTHGTVTAPDGMQICSPGWIVIGENTKIPYKWGGFNTLQEFDAELSKGKYAGDIYTSKDYGSLYCVGVDCSGFVSRCWKLEYHCPTSAMPSVTVAYSSWEQLKKGDAIHKVGHVRMCVQSNPSGTVDVVESSGADWRVTYRTYTFSQLTGYTPRYFIGMTDMPTVVVAASPPNGFLLEQNYPNPFNSNAKIEYQTAKSGNVSLKVYDILGREVTTLVDEEKPAGNYAVDFSAGGGSASGGVASRLAGLPSGVYFYRLSVVSDQGSIFVETRKMTLLR